MTSCSEGEWERTGNKNVDQLHLYTTSNFYDISFKVGSEETGFKIFKCHKLVLATASVVFEKMFYRNFKEAKMGPDEPILLSGISSHNFDIIMKFIYGNVEDFHKSTSLSEMYRFAHEMNFSILMRALENHFKTAGPSSIFAVLELYKLTENVPGQERCWDVITDNPVESLASESWLSTSMSTVQELLQNNDLSISELQMLKALIRWGEFQVKQNGEIVDDMNVRTKILPCLKFIMFRSITYHEFAEFCTKTDVFTAEEKYKILVSLILDSVEHIPTEFKGFNLQPRQTSTVIADLNNLKLINKKGCHCPYASGTLFLSFNISNTAYFLGFQVDSSLTEFYIRKSHLDNISDFTLLDSDGMVNAAEYSNKLVYSDGLFKFMEPIQMFENTTYMFNLNTNFSMPPTTNIECEENTFISKSWLKLTIVRGGTILGKALINKLIFTNKIKKH